MSYILGRMNESYRTGRSSLFPIASAPQAEGDKFNPRRRHPTVALDRYSFVHTACYEMLLSRERERQLESSPLLTRCCSSQAGTVHSRCRSRDSCSDTGRTTGRRSVVPCRPPPCRPGSTHKACSLPSAETARLRSILHITIYTFLTTTIYIRY